MIGRADIEGSKSDVDMNSWPPQASYPCGNFSDTSSWKFRAEGSIGHAFTFCIRTGDQNQVSFYPFVLREISDLSELTLGHLRYYLEDMPPQPNSLPENFFYGNSSKMKFIDRISTNTIRVVVFHCRLLSHLYYTSQVSAHYQTRVKLNRVFFPRWFHQARSLGCSFAE